MTDKSCTDAKESTVWAVVLTFISKYFFPTFLTLLVPGIFIAYGAIKDNTSDISKVRREVSYIEEKVGNTNGRIDWVEKSHNSRIVTQQIGLEKTADRISKIEVLLPQIVDYMKENKENQRDSRNQQRRMFDTIASLEKNVAVLIDRSERDEEEK